jgi:hypothetical protein
MVSALRHYIFSLPYGGEAVPHLLTEEWLIQVLLGHYPCPAGPPHNCQEAETETEQVS